MAVEERDPVSGHKTTGHEWNGIKELDTPVPRGVLMFIIVTHVWALLWWILMPTWPLVTTYTKGLLGIDQRKIVEQDLTAAQAERAAWMKAIETYSFERDPGQRGPDEGRPDDGPPALRRQLRRLPWGRRERPRQLSRPDGRRLALGRRGGADRRDDASRHQLAPPEHPGRADAGLRARRDAGPHPGHECRDLCALPVQSGVSTPQNVAQIQAGREVFLTTCAACHGEDGKGNREVGAPNLTDQYWVYGGDLADPDHHDPRRAAGAHADLGRAPDAGGDQDPGPVRQLPERREAMTANSRHKAGQVASRWRGSWRRPCCSSWRPPTPTSSTSRWPPSPNASPT